MRIRKLLERDYEKIHDVEDGVSLEAWYKS